MQRLLLFAVLACFWVLNAGAQVTSRISGRVTDPGGATIAQAQVRLTNTDTNIVHTTLSGDDGSYALSELPAGPYRLDVRKEGFQAHVQSGIVLQVDTNPTVNVSMVIGNVTQTIEVQANAAMVETQNT